MAWSGSRLFELVSAVCLVGVLSVRHHVPVSAPEATEQATDLNSTFAFFDERFHLVEDLGYVFWYMNVSAGNRTRLCAGDVDVEELRRGLGADDSWHLPKAQPRQLEDLGRLRASLPRMLSFNRTEHDGHYYKPPLAMPPIATAFAASQRFDFSNIDFIMGGSLLYALATGDFDGKGYTVQRWGGAVLIRRFSLEPNFVDSKDKGLQVKCLITGRLMNDVGLNETAVQHLQLVRVGNYTVLFTAEVDAVDERGRVAEVKTLSSPNWRKIFFQMMAKGATTLVHGVVTNAGPQRYLSQIVDYDLRYIFEWTTTPSERGRLATNIIESLGSIHARVFDASAGEPGLFHMNGTEFYRTEEPFWTHTPKLVLSNETKRSLLPEARVLDALFPSTAADDDGMSTSSTNQGGKCAVF